ncbi:MAG: AAA family ATPase [Dongiaceae bacterium]
MMTDVEQNLAKKPPAVTYTADFLAFAADAETRATLSSVASQNWPGADVVKEGGVNEAIAVLTEGTRPQTLIVDFSSSPDPLVDARHLRSLCPHSTVIGLGATNDVSLFRNLLTAGISDYLVKPLNPESLSQAIVSAQPSDGGTTKSKAISHVTAIIGARGGVGASTLAVNTAWLLAEEKKSTVALIDLDVHYGITALALDVEPSPGLREALKNPDRIDSLFVTSALVKATDRLYIMGSEEPLDAEIRPNPAAVELLLQELRARFTHIIVDVPRSNVAVQELIAKEADYIILVSDLTLVGIRDTARLLSRIKALNAKAKTFMVVNRSSPGNPLSAQDFERGVEHKIDITIEEDGKTLTQAMNSGRPLAAMGGSGKTLISLNNIIDLLLGNKNPPKKQPWWSFVNKWMRK